MLYPEDIEKIPIPFQQIFAEIGERIMIDVMKRLSILREITPTTDYKIYQLVNLGVHTKTIEKYIQLAISLSEEELDKLYEQTIKESYIRDKSLYKRNTELYVPFEENEQLQQLIRAVKEQTKQEFANITQTQGFRVTENGRTVFRPLGNYLQKKLDGAILDISSGAFDSNSIITKAITELSNSGLRIVEYESGWTNDIEVVVRRAVMTGSNQVTNWINEFNAQTLGTDKFEVSWHRTARPTHQVWQGRVYTREQLLSVCGLGDVTGLNGANCYHSYYPFIEGVSKRMYTDEELEEMNARENIPREYNGKSYTQYEATQEMRNIEATIRKFKKKINLLESIGGYEKDLLEAKTKYREWNRRYKEFSKKMDLPEQRQRLTIGA